MEAKKTIMNDSTKRQFRTITDKPSRDYSRWDIEGMLALQAEISFKVGKTAGVAESLIPSLKAIEASRKAGQEEVVEWIKLHPNVPFYDTDEWQSQLKKWGL